MSGLKKDDTVMYCGKGYRVVQVFHNSDVVVIKSFGPRSDVDYVWAWKCRKVQK